MLGNKSVKLCGDDFEGILGNLCFVLGDRDDLASHFLTPYDILQRFLCDDC
jgi:hypothetical protein